jgi:hypothetical protein
MKLQLEVTHDGVTHKCETSLIVLVEWERKYKKRTADLAQGFALEDLAYMAWASLKRAGQTVGTFDAWLEKLQDVQVLGGEDSNPTDAAGTAAS